LGFRVAFGVIAANILVRAHGPWSHAGGSAGTMFEFVVQDMAN